MATSAAAVFTSSLGRASAAPKSGTKPAAPPAKPMTPAIHTEIAAQKKSLEDTLKIIRGYKLPPGSPPAFVFRAQKRDVRHGR